MRTNTHTLTCTKCGATLTSRTKAEQKRMAEAGMWKFTTTAPECYPCWRASCENWKPGDLTPF